MEHIEIREVTTGDVGFLFRLMNDPVVLKALHEVPTRPSDWEEAVAAWLADEDEQGYIIFDREVPVGWFAVNGLLAEDGMAFLKMAVLLPAYQNRKIGSYVLAHIMGELKAAGFTALGLFTDQDNARAQACYKKCGFRVVESLEERMSDGAVVARYRMERRL